MKLLLDTHIWLWSVGEPERLSQRVTSELTNSESELWLSPISIWELGVLQRKGRIAIDQDIEILLPRALHALRQHHAQQVRVVCERIACPARECQRVRAAEVRLGERLRHLRASGEPHRDLARFHETGVHGQRGHRTDGDEPVRQAPRRRREGSHHRAPPRRITRLFGK